ncbi:MAG: hypothetical protein QOF48_3704 [Verrucomicrobiota bacterium]|jgi:hypothetical protein
MVAAKERKEHIGNMNLTSRLFLRSLRSFAAINLVWEPPPGSGSQLPEGRFRVIIFPLRLQ